MIPMLTTALTLIHDRTWASYGNYPPPVAPFTNRFLPSISAKIKIVYPVLGSSSYRNSYNANYGTHRHTGVDIRANKMTPIVAPFDGVFGNKVHSFWIYGDNGYKCLGTHLNDDTPGTNNGRNDSDFMFAPNLRFGDRVQAGQLIGYVGDSGEATGPHLHFEIYKEGQLRSPFSALQQAIKIKSPTRVIRALDDRPEKGEERFEICKRNWVESTGSFYGILTAKQYDNGRVITSKQPSFVNFKLPKELVNFFDISSWSEDRPASIYFERSGGSLRVTKVVPPDN